MEENNEKKQGNEEKATDGKTPVISDNGWAKAGQRVKDYGAISGVLVLVVSGFAYLCAYFYELGFCQQFGIPSGLIDISWIRFLTATIKVVALLLAFCTISLIFCFFVEELHSRCKSIVYKFFGVIIGVVIVVSLLFLFFCMTETRISTIEQYYVCLVLIVLFMLLSVLYERLSKKWPTSKPLSKGVVLILWLVLFLFFIPFAYNIRGSEDTLQDKEYAVLSSNESIVMLRIYGDNAICVPWYFDNESEHYTISKEFAIYPLDSITLIQKEIGPLHVKEAE